jgi:hypothetical protein
MFLNAVFLEGLEHLFRKLLAENGHIAFLYILSNVITTPPFTLDGLLLFEKLLLEDDLLIENGSVLTEQGEIRGVIGELLLDELLSLLQLEVGVNIHVYYNIYTYCIDSKGINNTYLSTLS